MNTQPSAAALEELDGFVYAFEKARAAGPADLERFLPPGDHPLHLPVLRELVRVDLELGWRQRRPRPLDDYLRRHPGLALDRASLREIAYEEYRLRHQAGLAASPEEYARRLGIDTAGWFRPADAPTRHVPPPDAERIPPYQRAAEEAARTQPHFPRPGDDWCGFRLLGELGRGAFARVYLARQGELADRLVAVKVCPGLFFAESQKLARLQHTHIVPVYSVHRLGPLVAVCMPYFGSATLADVLRQLRQGRSLPAAGDGLLAAVRRVEAERGAELGLPAPAAAGPEAAGGSYVEAVLRVGAALAEGLAHAHARGIVHRDIKPANVLLTAEGVPLLLDFNLAEDTTDRASAAAAQAGGTLPYMPPEALDAFREGRTGVDARGDVFALGVLLHELLTGRHPYPQRLGPLPDLLAVLAADRRGGVPGLRRHNRAVSPAVEAVVRRCLEPDPGRRYQTAGELAEDLRRQLEHRPLRHTREPSLRERLGKWARRHPRLASSTTVAVLALALLAALAGLVVAQRRQQRRLEARDALHGLRQDVRRLPFLLLDRDADGPQRQDGLELCRRQAGRFGVLDDPDWHEKGLAAALTPREREELRHHAGELLWWWGRAAAWRADADVTEALRVNERALACYADAPGALWRQRAGLLRRAGREAEAAEAEKRQGADSPRERYLTLGELADAGRWRQALPVLQEAARHDARGAVVWLLFGHAYAAAGQRYEAAASYDMALSLEPELPWGWFHRGLLRLRLGRHDDARADFDRVLELRPGLAEALMNRALAHLARNDLPAAEADLTAAIDGGAPYTRLYFQRGRVRAQAGNPAGAAADVAEGLRREPTDDLSWVARGVARLPGDADGAVADFDRALAVNPRSLAALQNKAHVLAEHRRRPADAVGLLDAAVRLHPDAALPRAGRGVLLARLGKRGAALTDARAALARDRDPRIVFQVAGIYALTSRTRPGDRAEALRLLREALRQDAGLLALARRDPDLGPIRATDDFKEVLRSAGVLHAAR